jgi:hypothetical protein
MRREPKRGEPQCALVGLAELLQRPDVHRTPRRWTVSVSSSPSQRLGCGRLGGHAQNPGGECCRDVPQNSSRHARCHLLPPRPSDIWVTNDLRMPTPGLRSSSGLRVWVELRGFEPLTPSMRIRFTIAKSTTPRHRRAVYVAAFNRMALKRNRAVIGSPSVPVHATGQRRGGGISRGRVTDKRSRKPDHHPVIGPVTCANVGGRYWD